MGANGSAMPGEQSNARGTAVRENLARARGVFTGIRKSLEPPEPVAKKKEGGLPPMGARRRFPRYPIQIPFVCAAKTSGRARTIVGWTRNLAEGGACIELSEPFPPETPVWIRMRSDQGSVEMGGKVIWCQNGGPKGERAVHGLGFTEGSPGNRKGLETLIISRGVVAPSRVRLPLELPVTCEPVKGSTIPIPGWTWNVSRGGLMLRLPRELSPGTELRLILHTEPRPLTFDGAIAWVAPLESRTRGGPIRHGFRFTRTSWSSSAALGRLLADPR